MAISESIVFEVDGFTVTSARDHCDQSCPPIQFYTNWLASGVVEFPRLHSVLLVPVYYLFGLLCVLSKMLFLNPPGLDRYQSSVVFEARPPFPGAGVEGRREFARKWYSMSSGTGVSHAGVSSRFAFLPARCLWIEQLALQRFFVLPAQSGFCVFDEQRTCWHFCATWWMPHLLTGWVLIGESPADDGWLIAGEIRCWGLLKPVYRSALAACVKLYDSQLKASLASGELE